jgi:LPPG:FO 2-phospho-L-lactate transferase
MKIAALAGGVGGAKLAQGLSEILDPGELTVVVNTGDDAIMYGLYICPDLDTVCYTLAGMSNPVTGWGIKDDTFHTIEALDKNGCPAWFRLGDQDLATHLERTRRLQEGQSLTEVTLFFNQAWKIKHPVLPMCNEKVTTCVDTVELGILPFQEYFVKHRFEPIIKSYIFRNIENARPSEQALQALEAADAIVICPSNPFVSIDPITNLHGINEILRKKFVLAVSPIIGGKAVKGSLAKMYAEMNLSANPATVAGHYTEFLDCIYLDNADIRYGQEIEQSGIIFQAEDIMMPDLPARKRLAEEIMSFLKTRNI